MRLIYLIDDDKKIYFLEEEEKNSFSLDKACLI